MPEGAYFLRLRHLEKASGPSHNLGRWTYDPATAKLTLGGATESQSFYSLENAETLRQLDSEGKAIESKHNHDLTLAASVDYFPESMHWRGMYLYMADAAVFTECRTGLRFRVAPKGDAAALESAYLKARKQPGEPVLVTFEGRFLARRKR